MNTSNTSSSLEITGAQSKQENLSLTRMLLLCGATAGPLFVLTLLVQDYMRPGFDPRLDMLSLLSLGDWGWVQITNFILAGVLNLFFSAGLWRVRSGRVGTMASLLIGAYGLGLITVGIFRTDPANGFPAGVPAMIGPSWHGAIHALGALFVFLMLAAGLVALARFFFVRKERGWVVYCLVSAILFLVCFFGSFTDATLTARLLRLGVLIGWMTASIVAFRLYCMLPTHR